MIKVSIVEDNELIREGLFHLINGSEGFLCLGSYSSAEKAISDIPYNLPNVVLMDLNLPGMSGVECIKKLKEKYEELLILVLTIFEDNDQIFNSLVAGASGYILKKTPPAELLKAIQDIFNGGAPMSDQVARKVVNTFHNSSESAAEKTKLSKRESEILSLLAKGFHDKEIADTLYISFETVRTHLKNIYKKLHVRSRTEALLKYLRNKK